MILYVITDENQKPVAIVDSPDAALDWVESTHKNDNATEPLVLTVTYPQDDPAYYPWYTIRPFRLYQLSPDRDPECC